ncbi:MAG: hypothetical protein KC503_26420 [Myxococcales bacterium]|nr:hypothetical protein [Myxococcales bacterium]
MPDVRAACPHCALSLVWDVDISVEREIAFAAPNSPRFPFACPSCSKLVAISFEWHLVVGDAPRRLEVVGGAARRPELEPAILLVDECPHGCGCRLGLQLRSDDPWAQAAHDIDDIAVLGGYRCPRCDGEGILELGPVIRPYSPDQMG